MKIYQNATLITLDGGRVIEGGALVTEGSRIEAVLSAEELARDPVSFEGAEIADCSGRFILPGLINAHMHSTLWRSFGDITAGHDVATETLMAARNGINCLRKGITTIRELGHNDGVHNPMKKARDRGVVLAPRFYCADTIIEMSWGHANHFCHCVSSPWELVAEIRRQVNAGTDFIKLIASHDDLWHLDNEEHTFPWFSAEDLRLAAETAHELSTRVSAHANGTAAIGRCLDAGLDCIEHGIGLTAEQAAQMKEQGTYYCPTLTGYKENGTPVWNRGDEWVARCRLLWERHQACFGRAVEAGVRLIAGTDTLGDLNEEIALLHGFGLSREEALLSATVRPAELMGWSGRIGRLKAGLLADFIVLRSNPLEDLAALYDLEATVLDGRFLPAEALDLLVPPCRQYAKNW